MNQRAYQSEASPYLAKTEKRIQMPFIKGGVFKEITCVNVM